jgi:excisionase family DNA binding protein
MNRNNNRHRPNSASQIVVKGAHRLKTLQQVADELNLSIHTIRAWVAQRRLRYVKLGRSVRVSEDEVERVIQLGDVPPRSSRHGQTIRY